MDHGLSLLELNFGDTGDAVNLKEFSDYLVHLRIAYGIGIECHSLYERLIPKDISNVKRGVIKRLFFRHFRIKLRDYTFDDLYKKYYKESYNEKELILKEISYQSPIRIVLYGSLVPLVMAAIISGGKVKAPGFTFELAPIGVGLKEIRKALEPSLTTDETNIKCDKSNLEGDPPT